MKQRRDPILTEVCFAALLQTLCILLQIIVQTLEMLKCSSSSEKLKFNNLCIKFLLKNSPNYYIKSSSNSMSQCAIAGIAGIISITVSNVFLASSEGLDKALLVARKTVNVDSNRSVVFL